VRKEAWAAPNLMSFTGQFFSDSYLSHENALIRPRYNGYVALQEKAGVYLQQFIMEKISDIKLWDKIENCYRESRFIKI
ncbi:MAG: hypothetical protein ACTHKF_05875, partial [Candidatus Nitrosocosmicus sp.]